MQTERSDRTRARRTPTAPAGRTGGDPMLGRLIEGRYRIEAPIARGGMATVYEATDLRLDRTVAVKVMHAGMATAAGDGDDFAARFQREARAAARLSHPNVVAVFDQGVDEGVVFLAMELVGGRTLRDLLAAEAPMPPARALALLDPVLSALAAAHRAGLVHRDVKPENVLISDDGTLKVADFGLARAVSAGTQHTATQGVLIGTVSYLAPELVVEGRSDARADVYAAGVMLYEMLTGAKPHEGESPIHVAYQHVHADVPAPSRLVTGLPAYVDALVARATARDRAQRSPDAAVLLRQVRRVAQALEDGAGEDTELTLDLRPTPPARVPEVPAPPAAAPPVAAAPAEYHEHTTAYPDRTSLLPGDETAAPARRRRRRGPVVLALGLVLAVAVGGGAYWLSWGRYVSTPGIIGLSATGADGRLGSAGLDLDVAEEAFSESVPEGRVIRTEPAAGDRVLPGGTVSAVVSLGRERYDVPTMAGQSEDQAQDALLALNLDPDESVERWSEDIPAGNVIRSRPVAGTTLRPGSPVAIVLSKGRRPIQVGDWVGTSFDEAATTLRERGLTPVVDSEAYDDDVPDGDVISHDPAEGTVFRGDTVSFVVSQGPELVAVPGGVVASGVESARETLEGAGFEVTVANDDSFVGLGFVVGMEPGEGEMLPRGSTVTLYVV